MFWLATPAGPVRILVSDQESTFFVSASSLNHAKNAIGSQLNWRSAEIELSCFSSASPLSKDVPEKAVACYFRNQRDLGFARALLQKNNISCLEADVRPTDRFLMERFIRGTAQVSGEFTERSGYLEFIDPKLRRAECDIALSIVSLDIETSISQNIVLSIAVQSDTVSKVFMLGEPRDTPLDYLEFVNDEKKLITTFVEWFSVLDPDVVIGWSIVGFDLKFLQDRCDALGISFAFGRGGASINWRFLENQQRYYAVVPGRVILDGIELLRTATYRFDSFSLENVAREMLGRGKLVHNVDSRAYEIEEMHRQDQESLAKYNLEDCALVLDIFKHANLIEFATQRGRLTGLELDRQGGSVAAFDFLYLPQLHRAGFVAPVVNQDSIVNSPGGYVLDSSPGIYEKVMVFDFKSLYPSIIRTFHVDPLAMVAPDNDRIPGFLEASFSKNHFLLPRIIEELWLERDRAKSVNDVASSQAIKIIMNSFYGVLGTPGCRFFDARLASSITMRGHEILQKTRDLIEERGYRVIYGDTDSVFVLMDMAEGNVDSEAQLLSGYLNDWWRNELQSRYQIESYLEIEFETHFSKFFMPTIRGSSQGSKKRYAGMLSGPDATLVFKGLESVRSDWTPLAREFQRDLYQRVFVDEPVIGFVKETVQEVLSGQRDSQLTFRRRLRRKLVEYVKNVPPHVRAARLADEHRAATGLRPAYDRGGWIEYRMTVNGPEPMDYVESPIDYDFYIERQLAPIADAILGFQNTSLAEITDKQLGLFQ